MKQFNLATIVPQVELFSFIFWKNGSNQKNISKISDIYMVILGPIRFSIFEKKNPTYIIIKAPRLLGTSEYVTRPPNIYEPGGICLWE